MTPVWDEPYGLVVAEALACGTPVVAFARGGIPEVLHDVTDVVGPGPGRRWGGSCAPVTCRRSRPPPSRRWTSTARVVRRHARQHLSLDRMVTAYEQLYDRLQSGATWESGQPA